MRKFKFRFWRANDICVVTYQAASQYDALMYFYMANPFTDIISIEDVTDGVD